MHVTGLVIAGGRGSRMHDRDKGLVVYRGRPMVDWALGKLRPLVDEILISANRNLEEYGRRGCRVLPDCLPGFCGPLAGVLTAMQAAKPGILVTVPCDTPKFPPEVIVQLIEAVEGGAPAALAAVHGKPYPTFAAWRTDLAPALREYLGRGERRMFFWAQNCQAAFIDFDGNAAGFDNFNTEEELEKDQQ